MLRTHLLRRPVQGEWEDRQESQAPEADLVGHADRLARLRHAEAFSSIPP